MSMSDGSEDKSDDEMSMSDGSELDPGEYSEDDVNHEEDESDEEKQYGSGAEADLLRDETEERVCVRVRARDHSCSTVICSNLT
jgi:hypothetical protein